MKTQLGLVKKNLHNLRINFPTIFFQRFVEILRNKNIIITFSCFLLKKSFGVFRFYNFLQDEALSYRFLNIERNLSQGQRNPSHSSHNLFNHIKLHSHWQKFTICFCGLIIAIKIPLFSTRESKKHLKTILKGTCDMKYVLLIPTVLYFFVVYKNKHINKTTCCTACRLREKLVFIFFLKSNLLSAMPNYKDIVFLSVLTKWSIKILFTQLKWLVESI